MFRRYQLLRKKEEEFLKKQAALAREQLNEFTQNLLEKNKLAGGKIQLNKDEELIINDKLRKLSILTEEDWENYQKLFELIYPNFIRTVRTKIPDLTPAEIRYAAMLKLQLSRKEIAMILGISTDSIRKQDHRLRKKIEENQPNFNFEDLING